MKNECVFIGRLTREPELKNTGNGAVCNLGIACEETWKDKQGVEQRKVVYPKLTAFGSQAGLISKTLERGDLIQVQAKYQIRPWKNKEGKKQYDHSFVIQKIFKLQFLEILDNNLGDDGFPGSAEPRQEYRGANEHSNFTTNDIGF